VDRRGPGAPQLLLAGAIAVLAALLLALLPAEVHGDTWSP
jgi:hypothetical protein